MDKIAEYFALQEKLALAYHRYQSDGVSRTMDTCDKEYNFQSASAEQHYFRVGADALRICVEALAGNLRPMPRSILDFPSGSGRVTRHLRAFFQDARIVACDLYDYHIEFCRQAFGVNAMLSKEHIEQIDFGEHFDLIFCGSLLTHLPEDQFVLVLDLLARSLSERGMAIITLQSRHAYFTPSWTVTL